MVRDDCTSGDIPGDMVEVTDLAMQYPTNGAIAAPCGPRAPFTVPRSEKAGTSENEVRSRHAADAAHQNGEFSGAVGIGAAEKQVFVRIEYQLPGRVGTEGVLERERAIAGPRSVRIDIFQIDPVLASHEVG